MQQVGRARPLGITIISVILAIQGILTLIGAIASFAALGGGVGTTLGIILLIVGVLELVLAWGLWTLQPWAFWVTAVVEALNVLGGIWALIQHNMSSSTWVSLIVGIVVLIYLFADRNVRAAFRT